MAKMIWAETPLLPDRPQQFTEAQFKIHKTNGWVEIDPPDVDPDAKQPVKTTVRRPPSDKKPASETMIERSLSDKKPAPVAVVEEPSVKKPSNPSAKKPKSTTKPKK